METMEAGGLACERLFQGSTMRLTQSHAAEFASSLPGHKHIKWIKTSGNQINWNALKVCSPIIVVILIVCWKINGVFFFSFIEVGLTTKKIKC